MNRVRFPYGLLSRFTKVERLFFLHSGQSQTAGIPGSKFVKSDSRWFCLLASVDIFTVIAMVRDARAEAAYLR